MPDAGNAPRGGAGGLAFARVGVDARSMLVWWCSARNMPHERMLHVDFRTNVMSERGVLNTLGTASAVHGRVAESGTRRPPDGMFARFSFLRLPAGRAVPFLDVLDPNGPCRTDAAARADRKPGSLHAPAVRRRQVHIDRSINRSRSLVKRRSRPVEWWPSIDVSVIWGRCRRPSGRQRLAPCARVPEGKTLASGGEPVRN